MAVVQANGAIWQAMGGDYQRDDLPPPIAIDDEFEIDPEGGAYLLEVHLEAARKASH